MPPSRKGNAKGRQEKTTTTDNDGGGQQNVLIDLTEFAASCNAMNADLPSGSKRPHSEISAGGDEGSHEDGSDDSEIDDDDPRLEVDMDTCDQVRRKIDTFINNGGMKVGEFQDAIGVSSHSYGLFIKQRGPHAGSGSNTYSQAWLFFKKRDLKGIKMPQKKAAKKATEKPSGNATSGAGAKKKTAADKDQDKYDVSSIHLDGEAQGRIPIFETCDSLRRAVAAHLRKDGIQQAAFLRQVSQQFGDNPTKISSAQLQAFQRQKGPHAGSSGNIFYGAYVYFEKVRVKSGKPKSAFRTEMEKSWSKRGGFPMEGVPQYFMRRGEHGWEDKYGVVHFDRR